ncbi:GNAT family N-acyltransferase [Nostocoides sp. F2B08]|uniref:GNAT family N-acyltransferase n=1 Tax=Nostocoides sp. F2B08 TaxID=2653936 RepID=UPI00186B2753|nr:GNAT family N-acyltransferase [Tetrasphaera sp. F2B08]
MASGRAESGSSYDATLMALGQWFIERTGLRVRVASGPAELQAVQQLRRHQVDTAGWEPGSRSTAAEEADDYDHDAVHLAAWDGTELAGTARVLLPAPGVLLPTEAAFDLRFEPAGAVVECGRWVVSDGYRDGDHRVSMGLSGLACLEVVSRGYSVWGGMTTPPIIELWRGIGVQMETLAPPRTVLGEQRLAVRCDLRASLPGMISVLGPLGAPVPPDTPV